MWLRKETALQKKALLKTNTNEPTLISQVYCLENIKKRLDRNSVSTQEVLPDTKFVEQKRGAVKVAELYRSFDSKKAYEVSNCGKVLVFVRQRHRLTGDERLRLVQMYSCKDRFCPLCNWRRARKLGGEVYRILKGVEGSRDVRYVFLTLTVKNPKMEELRRTIREMMAGFNRFMGYLRSKGFILGWVRTLEYHPQRGNPDYVHPHFHILLVVDPMYFKGEGYIDHGEWQRLWKRACRLGYDPDVDVRVVRPKGEGSDPLVSGVSELVKYPLKSVDLEGLTPEKFEVFTREMRRVRSIGFGGVLKELRRALKIGDDGVIDLVDDSDGDLWEDIEVLEYEYRDGVYYLRGVQDIESFRLRNSFLNWLCNPP